MAISVEEARAMTEEQLQETITEIAFEIIANVGAARGMYIEAIQEAKAGNFDRAKELMAQARKPLYWATTATPTCWSGRARG